MTGHTRYMVLREISLLIIRTTRMLADPETYLAYLPPYRPKERFYLMVSVEQVSEVKFDCSVFVCSVPYGTSDVQASVSHVVVYLYLSDSWN